MNLAEMARGGFPVPPGFIVSTAAYRLFVAKNGLQERIVALAYGIAPDDPLSLARASERIRALFGAGSLPEEISTEIREAYIALARNPALPVAVRSSATAEDLPGLSFAGQQETYLNVIGTDAVLESVKKCWASLWTARALGYRARNHIPPDDVALAVVVQQMIPAEASGVLFTANPLTGRREEMVIDASFGLGEAVVAGQVEPDHFAVDAQTGAITTRALGSKRLAIVPRPGGGTEQVQGENASRQALPDAQIVALAQMAARVARQFGAPQDIEWAAADGQLYLLQSRPITSLFPLPDVPTAPGETRLYFSFGAIQGIVGPITPFGRDLLISILGGVFRRLGATRPANQNLAPAGSRLWIDFTDLARDPRLRRVLLAGLTRADPAARESLLRLYAEGRIPVREDVSPPGLLKLIYSGRRILGGILFAMRAPEQMRVRSAAAAQAVLEQVQREVSAAQDLPAVLDIAEHRLGLLVPNMLGHVFPVVFPAFGGLTILQRWLGSWLQRPPTTALRLMRGLPHNVTTEMDLELWAAAQAIRADPPSRDFFHAHSTAELAAAFAQGALPAAAQGGVRRFLDTYGMRAMGEIDIGQPRWRDDPTPLFQTLANYLDLTDPDLAPDVIFRRGAAEAEELGRTLVAEARRTRFGFVKARMIAHMIHVIRELGGMREYPKFLAVTGMDTYRRALLHAAAELVARGHLDRADDIFFLPIAALRRYVADPTTDLRAILAEERAEYERERGRKQIPHLLLSTGEAFYEGVGAGGENAPGLSGEPVSPGVAEGRARIVLDPRGVRLEPGEILVCPATDPGWTPLFLTAAGLVMEVGGLVTHGSVVAREYGIPAVVGVQNATTRLQTGQRVRVDGNRGRVTVLAPP